MGWNFNYQPKKKGGKQRKVKSAIAKWLENRDKK